MLGGKSQSIHRPNGVRLSPGRRRLRTRDPHIYRNDERPAASDQCVQFAHWSERQKREEVQEGAANLRREYRNPSRLDPIQNVLQMWFNATRYQLNFLTFDQDATVGGGVLPSPIVIPDANFYAVVGATFIYRTGSFPFSPTGNFNDFGGPGAIPYDLSGQEFPMWNAAQAGPDLSNPSSYRYIPCTYRWLPSYGNQIAIDASLPAWPVLTGILRIYYAQKSTQLKRKSPLQQARLTFEAQLGTGPEFEDLESQRVVAPEFAGVGSRNIDCGVSGMIPSLVPEVQGSHTIYARGDADFTDMIEDVIRSGVIQTGNGLSEIQRGVNCNEYPGPVQKKYGYNGEPLSFHGVVSDQSVRKGNILLFYARKRGNTQPTVADDARNTWLDLFADAPNGDGAITVKYAIANADGPITISVTDVDYDRRIPVF